MWWYHRSLPPMGPLPNHYQTNGSSNLMKLVRQREPLTMKRFCDCSFFLSFVPFFCLQLHSREGLLSRKSFFVKARMILPLRPCDDPDRQSHVVDAICSVPLSLTISKLGTSKA